VLCVIAHPDDEVIGCGGTLARASEEGATVRILLPTVRADRRGIEHWAESLESLRISASLLGGELVHPPNALIESKEEQLFCLHDLVLPHVEWADVVLSHWHGDTHQTHRAVSRAVEIATRPFRRRRTVALFEVSTATDQSFCDTFSPNMFVLLSERHVARKLEAMALYRTELAPGRTSEDLQNKMEVRGRQAGTAFAEAFALVRHFV
jgi:LmbE family N-acetylglucosaminyl deacetylase